jgi:hypothetical protein
MVMRQDIAALPHFVRLLLGGGKLATIRVTVKRAAEQLLIS